MEARHGCVRIQDTLRLCFKENNENPQPNFHIFLRDSLQISSISSNGNLVLSMCWGPLAHLQKQPPMSSCRTTVFGAFAIDEVAFDTCEFGLNMSQPTQPLHCCASHEAAKRIETGRL